MCLSIGAPSVSIWKKATSNRRQGYRFHICRAGRIQRAGVHWSSFSVSAPKAGQHRPAHGSTRLLVFCRVVFRGFRAPMNQQRRHLLPGPRRSMPLLSKVWKNNFKHRGSFKVTDLAGRTGTRREASGCIHLGQVLYGSRLGDPHLRARIDLDYALRSRELQGLAAVSFLMPRFTDPP